MSANVWESLLSSVEKRVNHQSFSTWFRPITYSHSSEKSIFVRAPNPIFVDWIYKNYTEVIDESMQEQGLRDQNLQFLVEDNAPSQALVERKNDIGESSVEDAKPLDGNNFPSAIPIENEQPELPLNPKYTFDSFVVGSSNQFAHAAALAVAESPSKAYNPLFIYGGVGLGKTHLMHAIGHAIRSRSRHTRLSYISSEKFMNRDDQFDQI